MEVSQYRTQAALVVFGACLSGTGRVTAGNDVYGFSHAVLQSGARAYMGALWKVNDFVTMLLLVSFFRQLATPGNDRSLASCFQHAQQTVYGLDKASAVAMLKEMSSELDKLNVCGVEGEDLNGLERTKLKSLTYLRSMAKDIGEGDFNPNFKHPYYWAPFGLVGHGGLCLH
jgi:CHAT domain-containing protein